MDCIVLAGGYARRMAPLTDNRPKHLLPVAGKPMLARVLDKVCRTDGLQRVYVSTNARFKPHFETFLSQCRNYHKVRLVVEDTRHEREKLGSLGALGFVIKRESISGELMVLGGRQPVRLRAE